MSGLHWTMVQHDEQGWLVSLTGFITEEADFRPLLALEGPGELRLDLAGIEQINSCGVREWIHFVRQLTAEQRAFLLIRCSPAFVRQLNTISNFRGGGRIRSVMLPYFCAECEVEEQLVVEVSPPGSPPIAEVIACPQCGGSMEFDDIPETYLGFLR